jgi:thiosulfate/3-mercaptopyruvate sulfurtransferase
MSHLENFDTVTNGNVEAAIKPTLTSPVTSILADIRKRLGSLVIFAGVFVLAACGGGTTSTTTATTTYPNAALLVSGASLDVNATNQVVIDVRSASLYAAGHVTKAINLPNSALNSASNTLDSVTAAAALSAAGVSNTAKIIVYGAEVDGNAGWVFWALEYLGATDVHILDGGYTKWVADGRTVDTTAATLPAATFTPTANAARFATKADVVAHYADTTNYAVIDSRNSADYLTARIPNAVNILIGDFVNADKSVKSFAEIKTLLDSKGVTSGKTVITHCYVGWRSAQEYFMLKLMGFPVSNFDGSWTEWAADTTLPTETSLLASGAALNVGAANQVIIDTRSAADYAAGHIANAINLDPHALDTTPTSTVFDPTVAAAVLGAAGVSNTANIVVYGAGTPSVDFGGPERVFWALEYLGAGKVSILDGGYTKWVADSRTVVTTTTSLPATTFTPTVAAAKLATKSDVTTNYTNAAYKIIDSRFNADYQTAHIPGAINILESDYLNVDGTTKSNVDIWTMLGSKGVTAGKTIITHCYVGYMSAQGYFMFRRMGFTVSNYDGSWTEWAADPTPLPVNTGNTP